MKNASHRLSRITLACIVLIASGKAAQAAQLTLSQAPAGNGGMEPAPNVIVTVDDSGSMDWDVTTDNTTSTTANKKITLLKNALKATFGDGTANSGIIPDSRIRLAWQAMHNNGNSSGAGSLTPGNTNTIRPFVGTHRNNFNSFINSLTPNNGTPSLKMMKNVYDYARAAAGEHSPWSNAPSTGVTQDPNTYLTCRRMYHIFMTDGAWNSQASTDRISNGDSNNRTLGDGTTLYSVTSNQTRVYRDNFGDAPSPNDNTKASTLSDFAFRNWATDMQDGTGSTAAMANNVRPLIKKSGDEVFSTATCTAANNCTTLQEFWNPRNDPATWQHVTQYTIGFGLGAVNWPYRKGTSNTTLYNSTTASNINARTTPADWDYNNSTGDTFGGDLPRLVQGELVWPDVYSYDTSPSSDQQDQRTIELWHAALNGRGRYYPAKTASALTAAFNDILSTVIADTSRPLLSIATSSNFLTAGQNVFIAGYSALKYSGSMSARPLNSNAAIAATETWNAGTVLDAKTAAQLADRVVLSYSGTAGISWKTYSSLPSAHQTPLNKNSAGTVDNNGQQRVDYIRGDRTREVANGGIYRDRDSRFGDVVNSNIWYTGKPNSGYSSNSYATFRGTGTGGMGGRTPMVYIGANDGMLHGFSATDGSELLAYIPQGIAQGNLRTLTDANYVHRYFVDGSPFTGDAYIGSTPAWKTVLTGTLGAGGKGYFVLDVTDPSQFTASNAANTVMIDTTASTDADLGHIMSPPVVDDGIPNMSRQIVKMNNDRWAVVLGNGVNSTNEAPVLIIQYLDGDKAIKKLSPCAFPTSGTCSFKGTNGLSSPQLIDLNGDGRVDIAYAGDIKGNLWKFNLTAASDASWSTAFSGQPFFVAKRSSTTQPITAAPYWMPHPSGGVMVAVGTGQNMTDADQTNTATQSIYGLWDKSTFTENTANRIVTLTDSTVVNTVADPALTSLVQQSYNATAVVDSGSNYYNSTNNSVDFATKRGWYLDWPLSGQRMLSNIRAFSGQKIQVQTVIPKTGSASGTESCSASATTERSFQSVLNMFQGTPPASPPFTFVDPALVNTLATMVETSAGDTTLIRTDSKIKLLSSNCPVGQICNAREFNPGAFLGLRANWRQVLQ